MAKITANGWNKERIQLLLNTSHRAVEKAVVQIFNRQTEDEQRSDETRHHNGIGFTGADAEFLSDVAKKCIRYGGLTEKQVTCIRPKMLKYWKQLMEIAAESEVTPKHPALLSAVPVKVTRKPKQQSLELA